jgi:hypothetical protein
MKTFKITSHIALSAAILAAAGFYTPAAVSATYDAKNYPGATCQASSGSQEVSLAHSNSGTYNYSSSTLRVTCPIVRDNIVNRNGTYKSTTGSGFGVQVYVENTGAANALSCILHSNDEWGSSVAALVSVPAPLVGLNVLTLNTGISKPVKGHYVVTCTLPPKSSVRSYQVYEYLNTDLDS